MISISEENVENNIFINKRKFLQNNIERLLFTKLRNEP